MVISHVREILSGEISEEGINTFYSLMLEANAEMGGKYYKLYAICIYVDK